MEQQLGDLIHAIWVFIMIFSVFFGIFVFLLGGVLLAEFVRRERTTNKDDDWFERTHRSKEE